MMQRLIGLGLGIIGGLLFAASPVAAQVPEFPSSTFAQLDLLGSKGAKAAKPKATFTAKLTPETVAPGGEVTLSITAKLPADFYIYGTDGKFGGRTRITVETAGLEAIDQEFVPDHAPKTSYSEDFKVDVSKFYDGVTWTRRYRVPAEFTADRVTITGKLEGQYCSEKTDGLCIQVNPPFAIDVAANIAKSGGVTPAATVTAKPQFAAVVRPTKSKKSQQPGPIEFDYRLHPANAKAGDKVTLSITAWIDAGYHTFSLTQHTEGGSPTVITLDQVHGLKALAEEFVPSLPPHLIDGPINPDEKLETYEDHITWTQTFEVTAEQPGDYGVAGKVSYQVCDDKTCFTPPKTTFALGRLEATEEPTAPPVIADKPPAPPAAPPEMPIAAAPVKPAAAAPQDRGLFSFLLLCAGGGFLALLTPCSFPMVPITVSFFLSQHEQQHKRPWLLALVYCGSIVAAFTILGVAIAAIFGVSKLNELANIPWLNIIIGLVFVVFALNMLGMFEIQMPGWLINATAGKDTGGYLGAVFMALTFTLTSFTCTFAIAGTLLLGASKGEFYWPVLGMLAFGTAFAAPFFVLALVPGLLAKLPKSGGWMNSVKVVMGLLELGAAIKFFSIADPRQVLFDHYLVMLIWLVLAVVSGAYLLGLIRMSHDAPPAGISVLRSMLAMSFFVLAGLLTLGMAAPQAGGGFLMNQILAFAPPRFEAGESPLGPTLEHHGLAFGLDVEQARKFAARENRPLLLDFTGVNCANCRYMERLMAQPAWKQRVEKFIGVQMYVDVDDIPTIHDREYSRKIRKTNLDLHAEYFPAQGMPSYAIVTPDGKQVLGMYEGAETTGRSGSFVQFLDEAWAAWEQQQNGDAKQAAAASDTTR